MFFQGTLQEGISAALQQSKPVVCFVTDDGDESQQWETEFLAEDAVKTPLETQSVALKLQAGSEEAGHLEALFPVPRKPTVIVIQNGQLREYIAASTAKEEFLRRLGTALSGPSTQAPASTSQSNVSSQAPGPQPAVAEDNVDDDDDDLYGDVAPSHPQVTSTASSEPAPAPTIPSTEDQSSQIQAEQAARLEAEKKAKEAAAREAKIKEAKAKAAKAKEAAAKAAAAKAAAAKAAAAKAAEATDDGNGDGKNSNPAETSYANMLRKRKQDERAERQRILQRIEDDKRERREREAQERKARQLLAAGVEGGEEQGESSSSSPPAVPLTTRVGGAAPDSPHCNLQIRLLDGSTLRHRFASTATLAGDVRAWVDENRSDEAAAAAHEPYTFRVLLTPLPNRVIEPAEETQALRALGLAPSATLILVPRPRVAGVLERSGGALFSVWAGIYAFLAMVLGLPGILLGRGGGGGSGSGGSSSSSEGTPRARAGGWEEREETGGDEEIPMDNLDGQGNVRRRTQGQRIRRFENPDDRRRDQQLYNGNSLNFEPRRDDENEDN